MITREQVTEDRRMEHVYELFGTNFPFIFEPTLYSISERLSPDYRGGYWEFYTLSNGGFYMAPAVIDSFMVSSQNGYNGKMSADAFGVTACLYAYSHLSFTTLEGFTDECARQFHLLREYMFDHPEVHEILAAID
jgi:hypothetical protein